MAGPNRRTLLRLLSLIALCLTCPMAVFAQCPLARSSQAAETPTLLEMAHRALSIRQFTFLGPVLSNRLVRWRLPRAMKADLLGGEAEAHPAPGDGAPGRSGPGGDAAGGPASGGNTAGGPTSGGSAARSSRSSGRWLARLADDDLVDLDRLLEPGALAYAYVEVESARSRPAVLYLGSDGPLRAWLNGRPVFDGTARHRIKRDQHRIRVRLEQGRNRLLLKVGRGERWRLFARFADLEGTALPDVKVVEPPTPPQLAPLPPLVAVAGRTTTIPLPGTEGLTALTATGLPRFARLEPAGPEIAAGRAAGAEATAAEPAGAEAAAAKPVRSDTPPGPPLPGGPPPSPALQLVLGPGHRDAGRVRIASLELERNGAATRVPLPVLVVAEGALELTPPFDALVGARYPLEARVRRPHGGFEDLSRWARWDVVRGTAARIDASGVLEPLSPGDVVVRATWGALRSEVSVRIVEGAVFRPFLRHVQTVHALVSIYQDPKRTTALEEARLAALRGRDFIFRNTHGRLALSVDFLEAEGGIPRRNGSYWRGLEADLEHRGVARGRYGLIVGLGPAKGACYGAGHVLGAAAAYCSQMTMRYFVHEVQHAIDNVMAYESGLPGMVFGHGYTDISAFGAPFYPVAAGRHDAWEAAVLRAFDDYGRFVPLWNDPVLVADSDGDGLADQDPRLPGDEARFGSSSRSPDTDGDGLGDLEEYEAGLYRGSDPARPDTDGDGLIDGVDPWPMHVTAPGNRIPRAAAPPSIDGRLEEPWPLLVQGIDSIGQCLNLAPSCGVRLKARFYANWDEDALYLAVEANRPLRRLVINLDGSAEDGPWLGGDTWVLVAAAGRSTLLRGQGQLIDDLERTAPVPGSAVRFTTGRGGARDVIEVRIPRALGPGFGWDHRFAARPLSRELTLRPGRRLGLSLRLGAEEGVMTPFEEEVVVPFELAP